MNVIDNYIRLRKEIQQTTAESRGIVRESSLKADDLNKSLSLYETSLSKGNGFSQIAILDIKNELKENSSNCLSQVIVLKKKLQKSQKELDTLINKNPLLKSLNIFDLIINRNDFDQSIITLVKSHKEGTISNEMIEKARNDSMRFKEIELMGQKLMVKDNRKNYADMIIFNEKNQILFVKRNKDDEFQAGMYALPGGHVEPAEDPKTAVIREVEEEVYITLNNECVFPCGIYDTTDVLISYFCCKIDSAQFNIILEERELQQYEWVSMDDIVLMPLILNLKDNFENVIRIPVDVLNQLPANNAWMTFGATIAGVVPSDSVVGTGIPIIV